MRVRQRGGKPKRGRRAGVRQVAKPPALRCTLEISRLGRHGDGIADTDTGAVYIAGALPGERVEADRRGTRAELIRVIVPAPDRATPPCPHFGACGGCAVQHLAAEPTSRWKRGMVVTALGNRGLDVAVDDLVDAHGDGRRRVTLHAQTGHARARHVRTGQARADDHGKAGGARVGFMRARSHDLLEIEHCLVLAPGLENATPLAHEIATEVARAFGGRRLHFDIALTVTDSGIDAALDGVGELEHGVRLGLSERADSLDLARISVDGEPVVTRRRPVLVMGSVEVTPPPGGFLQATAAGERALAALVGDGIGNAGRVLDLFCGGGPFALRLAGRARVHAVDADGQALAALDAAWRGASGLRAVSTERRDLFEYPVMAEDLAPYDAVVFDPPRAGAQAQALELARSKVGTVIAVSCEPASFARDAATLVAGGYELARVTPVDQFRYAAHVEMVGVFRRR